CVPICRRTLGEKGVVCHASVASTQPAPSTGRFGWRVLTTLTDRARCWSDSGQVHIEVAKAKPVAHADRREEIRGSPAGVFAGHVTDERPSMTATEAC